MLRAEEEKIERDVMRTAFREQQEETSAVSTRFQSYKVQCLQYYVSSSSRTGILRIYYYKAALIIDMHTWNIPDRSFFIHVGSIHWLVVAGVEMAS